ncbi:atypical/PIKK/PI4K protein kinase [Rhizoctonia solani AG-1 IA]|uniref:Atypical/PIKK/PI4K protein kinase n=1 Tax=Thanatephorus cucumeris (strain AG1-IA) TaxID=983506 RepID=L8X403_THACA|nr:atypical/PIKK/PI4K protein kinase [Rhizoctonia solani AG-1 IA]
MSHALLLRLFLAPSFFSVHVALQYLKTYPDNIGITHYLTGRLREFDLKELEDVWGFICQSRRGTTKSESFAICQRVIHKCHDIVYGDPPEPAGGPYSSLPVHPRSRFGHKRVKPHAMPALVGMGTMLAGAPGMPALTPVSGQVAIEQGRREEPHQLSGVVRDLQDEGRVSTSSRTGSVVDEDEDTGYDSPAPGPSGPTPTPKPSKLSIFTHSTSSIQTVAAQAARTTPSLTTRPPRMSDDPFGQLDPPTPPSKQSTLPPVHSTPSIGLRPGLNRATSLNHYAHQESLLNQYDPFTQSQLLRGHYCRGEVQFLLTLESISNRLLVVPKLARVSALRAELTNLNNKLPAEICVPMWCPSSDKCSANSFVTQPHHRIVRIPPGESVVLNSAERAPYVLIMEFLNNDLDFDPSKRMNKEILRKLVTQKPNSRGPLLQTPATVTPFRNTFASEQPRPWAESPIVNSQDEAEPVADPSSEIQITPSTPLDPPEGEDEEIDLVEQLYGARLRDEPVDLSDTIVLPAPPKNKVLDMNRWQMGSAPSTPGIGGISGSLPRTPNMTTSGFSSRVESPANGQPTASEVLSMEDYSERMRTAAVMLAQLNANLVREPVTSVAPGSTPTAAPSPGPGTSSDAASAMRMRLQPAEAAAIRERIMAEMIALEDQRMARMMEHGEGEGIKGISDPGRASNTKEDEAIVRRELNRADPSAAVFRESWAGKKARIRAGSPYGHLVNWDDPTRVWLRQSHRICSPHCRRQFRARYTLGPFHQRTYLQRIATESNEAILKKTYGDPSSVKFARAQKNFAKSLAGKNSPKTVCPKDLMETLKGYFGFMLGNSPGGVGFESAPFKLPLEYVDVLGGVDSEPFLEFKKLFHEGFLAARNARRPYAEGSNFVNGQSNYPKISSNTTLNLFCNYRSHLPHILHIPTAHKSKLLNGPAILGGRDVVFKISKKLAPQGWATPTKHHKPQVFRLCKCGTCLSWSYRDMFSPSRPLALGKADMHYEAIRQPTTCIFASRQIGSAKP